MSLPIAWVLKDKHILLVGGGEVAETRVRKLVPEDCKLVVISPTLTPYILKLHQESKLEWIERKYKDNDLKLRHWSFVLTAIEDHATSKRIAHECRSMHIPVNVADVIPLCDFYFGANFQQGPLKVMVSTGSGAPRLAKRVLNELSSFADHKQYGKAISKVAKLRQILREQLPDNHPKVSQARMRLMKSLCDRLTFEELASLRHREMRPLVKGMILSTAACPAQPVGEVSFAADFIDETQIKEKQSDSGSGSGSDSGSESDSDSDSDSDNDHKGIRGSNTQTNTDSSDSDSDSDSDGSDTLSSIDNDSDSAPQTTSMKRKATECIDGYSKPQIPSYPFPKKQVHN